MVYEDDSFIAFMDRSPINVGHVLVLPKRHYQTLLDMPYGEVGELFVRAAAMAGAVKQALDADGINIGQNNGEAAHQVVPHVHVHVVPRYADDSSDGRWPSRKRASLQELAEVAERIRPFVRNPISSAHRG